jgi:nicotinamide riboside kinase
MKIAIIGTHSTGKTTIVKHLAKAITDRGQKVVLLPELARLCPMPINEQTSVEAQIWIQKNQKQKEDEIYDTDGILLCDRSTLDNYAYMQRAAEGQDIGKYGQQAARHMGTYTLVFKTQKLPIQAVDDGVRSVDFAFRDEIDQRIIDLLRIHRTQFHPLPPVLSYHTHVDFILKHIDQTAPQCVLPLSPLSSRT